MNMLFIVNARLPTEKAHGIAIMKACEALGAAGIHLRLLVPKRKTSSERVFELSGIRRTFEIEFLPTLDLYGAISDTLAFFLQAWSFNVAVFFKLLFGSRSRIVYTRDAPFALLAWLGYKVVYECHTISSHRKLFFFAARQVYGIVTISSGLKEEFIHAGFNGKNILIAPSGVDLSDIPQQSKQEVRDYLNISERERAVVYTGHLYARKGADTLAQAAERLSGATVYIVGGTPEDIAAFRKRYPDSGRIRVIGHVPHDQALLWQKTADVLVLPNTARDEVASKHTSPVKLFEYMASGVPIVASDVPALREVLDDSTALFVAPDDPIALATAIQFLLTHPDQARARAQRALAEVTRYTWRTRSERIAQAFFVA